MNALKQLTVGGKLGAAFTSVVLLMGALGGFAVWQLGSVYGKADSIVVYRLSGVRDSQRMEATATRMRTREYRLAVSKPDEVDTSIKRLAESLQAYEKAREDYARFIENEDERALYQKAQASWAAYMAIQARLVTAAREGRADEALQTVMGASRAFDVAAQDMKALADYNDDMATREASEAKSAFQASRGWIVGLLALAATLAATLGWAITRAITLPLRSAVALAESVAAGDLTRSARADGRDEVAQLLQALGGMVERLRDIVSDVRHGVESVGTASSQIATGNLDLSQRTEEQASNLQQTAAVEAARAGEQGRGFAVVASEVRSLAQRSSSAAREIKALIEQSVGHVEGGARLVADAGSTMGDIVSQVQKVADLVGEITAASQEQSKGIDQVGDAVAQLDQVTQQNAALVEESAAAADSMKQQAARLAASVAVFKLSA